MVRENLKSLVNHLAGEIIPENSTEKLKASVRSLSSARMFFGTRFSMHVAASSQSAKRLSKRKHRGGDQKALPEPEHLQEGAEFWKIIGIGDEKVIHLPSERHFFVSSLDGLQDLCASATPSGIILRVARAEWPPDRAIFVAPFPSPLVEKWRSLERESLSRRRWPALSSKIPRLPCNCSGSGKCFLITASCFRLESRFAD